jgi:hypothetical protein
MPRPSPAPRLRTGSRRRQIGDHPLAAGDRDVFALGHAQDLGVRHGVLAVYQANPRDRFN